MRRVTLAAAFVCLVSAAAGQWLPAGGVGGVPDWAESFGAVIQCRMGGGRLTALKYNDYGCWCGKGNEPIVDKYPDYAVDEIDRACRAHDRCYDSQGLHEGGACDPNRLLTGTSGFDGYQITCVGGRVTGFRSNHAAGSQADTCARRQYECDGEMVDAIAQHAVPSVKPKCPACSYQNTMMNEGAHEVDGACLYCDEESGTVSECTWLQELGLWR